MSCKHLKEWEALAQSGIQSQITRKVIDVQYKEYVVKFLVRYEGIERPRTVSFPRKDRCPLCHKPISTERNGKGKVK